MRITLGQWVRSRLFRYYLRALILLWLVTKTAMVAAAILFHSSPFEFHPFGEAMACAIELWVIAVFIRASSEDVLLGNIGLPLGTALAPLALLHLMLSLAFAVPE